MFHLSFVWSRLSYGCVSLPSLSLYYPRTPLKTVCILFFIVMLPPATICDTTPTFILYYKYIFSHEKKRKKEIFRGQHWKNKWYNNNYNYFYLYCLIIINIFNYLYYYFVFSFSSVVPKIPFSFPYHYFFFLDILYFIVILYD